MISATRAKAISEDAAREILNTYAARQKREEEERDNLLSVFTETLVFQNLLQLIEQKVLEVSRSGGIGFRINLRESDVDKWRMDVVSLALLETLEANGYQASSILSAEAKPKGFISGWITPERTLTLDINWGRR